MVKSPPAPPLVLVQSQLLLELLIVPLDDPALLGEGDEFFELRRRGQIRQPVLGRFRFPWEPFDQQPLLGMSLVLLVVAMRRPQPQTRQSTSSAGASRPAASSASSRPSPATPAQLPHRQRLLGAAATWADALALCISFGGKGPSPGFQTLVVLWIPTTYSSFSVRSSNDRPLRLHTHSTNVKLEICGHPSPAGYRQTQGRSSYRVETSSAMAR